MDRIELLNQKASAKHPVEKIQGRKKKNTENKKKIRNGKKAKLFFFLIYKIYILL